MKSKRLLQIAAITCWAALTIPLRLSAQDQSRAAGEQQDSLVRSLGMLGGTQPAEGISDSNNQQQRPGKDNEVTLDEALAQSAAGATIPVSAYNYWSYKDHSYHKGVLVGGNPFEPPAGTVTVDVVVIPLIITIIADDGTVTTFDPTAPNSCDDGGGRSAVYRVRHSPLVVDTDWTFNGVYVGKAQYINASMRAEFLNLPVTLNNPLKWSFAAPFPFPLLVSPEGKVRGTGCSQEGVVSKSFLNVQIQDNLIPFFQAAGVISPTKLAVFLMKNVVETSERGAHGHFGKPQQTYIYADYDTTNLYPGVHDITGLSHEVGEWMHDPFITNFTPKWNQDITNGTDPPCKNTLEVGDPLEGHDFPTPVIDGYNYHPQELAFFTWYYDNKSELSFGAGGKFSGNGTFSGPSKACPPGGTY